MGLIKTEDFIQKQDAEKYTELLCEAKLKAEEIEQVENMIKNPETIEVVALAFADNKESSYGNCLGKHVNTYDRQEQLEALTFFAQFMKKQLEGINQQINAILSVYGKLKEQK